MTIIECTQADAFVDDNQPTGVACCECGELFPTARCMDCKSAPCERCAFGMGDRCRECASAEPVDVALDKYLEFMGL
jgi:hypothetical protein